MVGPFLVQPCDLSLLDPLPSLPHPESLVNLACVGQGCVNPSSLAKVASLENGCLASVFSLHSTAAELLVKMRATHETTTSLAMLFDEQWRILHLLTTLEVGKQASLCRGPVSSHVPRFMTRVFSHAMLGVGRDGHGHWLFFGFLTAIGFFLWAHNPGQLPWHMWPDAKLPGPDNCSADGSKESEGQREQRARP